MKFGSRLRCNSTNDKPLPFVEIKAEIRNQNCPRLFFVPLEINTSPDRSHGAMLILSANTRTEFDVLPMYGDPLVSVCGALLMVKA